MEKMNTIVQWATILSPIIAVIIAVWASRKSAKDTAKQVAAIEASTQKQMESMKRLCLLQLSAAYVSLEMSLYEYSLGKENDNMELHSLGAELQQLQQQEDKDPREIIKLQQRMENLSKNAQYKGNFEFKIMMQQFRILEEMEKFKKLT